MTSLGRLSRSGVTLITVAVATIIFFAGVAYALVRPVTYQSQATMVLAPAPADPKDLPGVLDSFQRSGTAVTYVELLASSDLLREAGNPPVTVTVRSVPDSRIIRISAKATDKNIVQPALRSIITAADREQEKLVDIWDLRTLQAPNNPSKASTSTSVILIATLLLSLLGAVATWTLLRRYGSGPDRRDRPPGDGARAEALAAAGWLTREGPRYPTSR
jgi:capsular polysaccharide biosynthesis protein